MRVADTLDAVVTSQSIRTALIGAGPRGTSVLERLLANWAPARRPDATLHIDVVDPYPAGPGHVWQPGQSRLYLMNTQSFYPTVIPEDPELAAPLAGDDLRPLAGTAAAAAPARRSPPRNAPNSRVLGSADFPSRALYGRYLRSTLDELLARLPAGVSVEFHETTAASAVRPGGRDGESSTSGSSGGAVLTVDSVVLALGHLESRLSPEQRRAQGGGRAAGPAATFPRPRRRTLTGPACRRANRCWSAAWG